MQYGASPFSKRGGDVGPRTSHCSRTAVAIRSETCFATGSDVVESEQQSTMPVRYAFVGGDYGDWRVVSMTTLVGADLGRVKAISVDDWINGRSYASAGFVLNGFISNLRYATRLELTALRSKQEGLGRADARCAALIPLRKKASWWEMTQDERRAVFEDASHHTQIGLDYLPMIARQLFHARDLNEPFDFLTWFEFAPEHAELFDELLLRLRATREWTFVDREVDIRLERN
jgi:hypothetical protein